MAGDWLKIECVTPDKPEVFEIATQLNITPAEAFGRLFLVWRWFDQHTENGNATNVSAAYLNHIAGVANFDCAMRCVGWLHGGASGELGISIPHFDYHNGKSAKSRALTAKRVATHKIRSANAALTQRTLPREEKRRSKPPIPPAGAFERFWAAYPRRRSKDKALKAFAKINPDEQLLAVMLAAIERAKTRDEWRRDGGQFIPYPASWLNGGGWKDEDLAPAAIRIDA